MKENKKKNERKRVFNNQPFISLPALSLVKEPILPKALEVWQLGKVGPWILMGFLSLSEDCWALKQTSVIHSKCCWPRWNCFQREYKASSSKTHLQLGTTTYCRNVLICNNWFSTLKLIWPHGVQSLKVKTFNRCLAERQQTVQKLLLMSSFTALTVQQLNIKKYTTFLLSKEKNLCVQKRKTKCWLSRLGF